MALFSQNMVEIGRELAVANPAYINLALKFLDHFLLIASGMIRPSEEGGMWDEQTASSTMCFGLPTGDPNV